jgi:hypothetical protein
MKALSGMIGVAGERFGTDLPTAQDVLRPGLSHEDGKTMTNPSSDSAGVTVRGSPD